MKRCAHDKCLWRPILLIGSWTQRGPRRGALGATMLGNAVNFMERKTGLDIDGDGDVGETDKQQHRMRMMTQPRAQSNQVTNTSNFKK